MASCASCGREIATVVGPRTDAGDPRDFCPRCGGTASLAPKGAKAVLVVEFDLTGLSEDERESLTGAVLAQSDRMKGEGGYPSVDVLDCRVVYRRVLPRPSS